MQGAAVLELRLIVSQEARAARALPGCNTVFDSGTRR